MKTIKSIIAVFASLLALSSCEKDGDKILLSGFESSELIASTDKVVLTNEIRNQIVLSLAWDNSLLAVNNPEMGVADGTLTTSLQVSASSEFSSVIESAESSFSKAYTGAELNAIAKNSGLTPDVEGTLYFRLKASVGANMEPKYSQTMPVKVIPYLISMKELHVLDKEKANTIATLYSPTENKVYTGIMFAAGWQNCWFSENDGTIWGNYGADGHAFEISDSGDAWNCWFPEPVGCYYVTADMIKKEWTAMSIPALTVTGAATAEMKYSSATNSWKALITTTSDNAIIQISGTGKEYSASTGDQTFTEKAVNFAVDGNVLTWAASAGNISVPTAGIYTLTLDFSNPAQWTYHLESGEPEAPKYPSQLLMKSKADVPVTLTTLFASATEGLYQGFYNATQWENFKLADEENQIYYGSQPGSQFVLSSESTDFLWFSETNYVLVEANLAAMSWAPFTINQINVCGDLNGWSTTADVLTYDAANKVWKATCDFSTIGYGFYFLINADWNFSLKKGSTDGTVEIHRGDGGGSNLVPAETGIYTITLDLNNLTYTMVKQ